MHRLPIVLSLALAALLQSVPAHATTFLVDTSVDDVDAIPGDGFCATSGGDCTLRAAIQEANVLAGSDTITLPAGTYTLTIPGTNEDSGATGDLDITANFENLTINGAGAATTIIDGGGVDRVIHNCPTGYNCVGFTVQISDVTIRNGDAQTDSGGGIRNRGILRLIRTIITGNNATVSCGGGIDNVDTGSLRIIDSTITGNTAAGNGGAGMCNGFGSMAYISGTTISYNTATGASAVGGAMYNHQVADVTLTNCTISGNTADAGGGAIFNLGGYGFTRTSLNNVTITGNTTGPFDAYGFGGGGVATAYSYGIISLRNTIIAGNSDLNGTAPDCGGQLDSAGYNLIGSLTGCSFTFPDATNVIGSPSLGPLQNNGGITDTHELLPLSLAIDAGNPAGCEDWVFGVNSGVVGSDQRGISRPQGDACDIGAYEYTECGDGTTAPGEDCDDGNLTNGDCCSATCQFENAGSSCTDDGLFCDGAETCDGAGVCASAGNPCSETTCNTCQEALDSCYDAAGTACPDEGNACTQDECDGSGTCAHLAEPAQTCRSAATSLLFIKDDATDNGKDKLIWKWGNGLATDQTELADPTATTDYAFCVYDANGVVSRSDIPADSVKWKPLSDKGYKYKDPDVTQAGIQKVLLKGNSTENKSKAIVKGKGAGLFDPTLGNLPFPVTAQLRNLDTGVCLEGVFNSASKNTTAQFKAKTVAP